MKPAVYFGGKARIIDFALSNAVNSGIRKIAVATQYKAHCLIRHLQRGWGFLQAGRNEFLDILPASQRMDDESWYRGTADAVAQNIDIVDSYDIDYIVILAGDHIYKMDYEVMLRQHVESGADVTIGCLTVPRDGGHRPSASWPRDATGASPSFLEKPADPPATPEDPNLALASMGIYVFAWDFLRDLLKRDMADPNSSHDFGNDLIPTIVANGKAMAHRFDESCVRDEGAPAYWKDVGTVDAFWQANIDLTNFIPELNLWDHDWPIWTYSEMTPPAKFIHDEANRRGMRDLLDGVGRLRHLGDRGAQLAPLHAGPHQLLRRARPCRGAALRDRGPQRPHPPRGDRLGRRHPRGADRGRGPGRGRASGSASPSGASRSSPRTCSTSAPPVGEARLTDLRVLSVASECAPLVKTGGLADVVGALPAALAPEGVEMRVLLPGYPAVMAALERGPVGPGGVGPVRRPRRRWSRGAPPGSTSSWSRRRTSTRARGRSTSAPTGATGPTTRSASPGLCWMAARLARRGRGGLAAAGAPLPRLAGGARARVPGLPRRQGADGHRPHRSTTWPSTA